MIKYLPYLTCGFIVLFISLCLIDGIASKPFRFYGKVIDKHYKAEINSTSTGYTMTNNCETGVVTGYNYEGEKFILIVKSKNSDIVTINVKSNLYYQKKEGDKIECIAKKGLFSNRIWSINGVK